jgi:hypothetical protein
MSIRIAKNPNISNFLDFSKGEASTFPIYAMKPQYAGLLQNCHVSESGGICKNPGYLEVNSTPVAENLRSGYEFVKNDGTIVKLVSGGGEIYKVDTGNVLTAIKTGLDVSAVVRFATFGNYCIFVNGVDAPLKYDGTTVTALGGTPPATAFKAHVHKGRVWMIERTNKMLATHSALDKVEDYTTADDSGYIDFKFVLRKGDELVDVCTCIDLLVFLFKNHIAIYSGTDPTSGGDFVLSQLIEGSGAASTDMTQPLGSDIVVLDTTGFKTVRQVITTGSLSIGDLSEYIDPTIRQAIIDNTGGIYASAHCKDKGWLLFLIGTTIWVYSYTWKAWGRIVGADVYGLFSDRNNVAYLTGTGKFYQYNQGYSFNGANMPWIWKTAWLSVYKGHKCFPKKAKVYYQPGAPISVNIGFGFDGKYIGGADVSVMMVQPGSLMDLSSMNGIWDDYFLMDTEDDRLDAVIPVFGAGRSIQLTFSESSTQGPIEFNGLSILSTIGGF